MNSVIDPYGNRVRRAASRGRFRPLLRPLVLLLAAMAAGGGGGGARAEQGDIVINNYADKAGVRPVVFPHWFHRIRFTCKTCHADLGIKFKAGGNGITMLEIIDGRYCGACHNGQVAWSVENCNLCHSGKPGTPTQVHLGTARPLAAAAGAGGAK